MTAEIAVSSDAAEPPVRRTAAPATLRRLPVPPLAPPYDDEAPGPAGGEVVGALPLPFAAASSAVPRLRVVASPDEAPGGGTPAGPWSTRFVRTVLETLAGLRPVSQLGAWATPDVCRALARRVTLAEGCRNLPRGVGTLRSIHVSAPSADVAEVCAVVDDGRRVRALALRLEARGGGWRCTELRVG